MSKNQDRTRLAALAGIVVSSIMGASGACVLPTYSLTGSTGTSDTTTTLATGGDGGSGGTGAATSGDGGTGGTGGATTTTTTMETGGGGTGGTGTGGCADCPTKVQWAKVFGGGGDDDASTIARNPQDGTIVTGGTISGPVDFSVSLLNPPEPPDAYTLFLGPAGAPKAAASFGGTSGSTGYQSVRASATAPDGSTAIAIEFTDTLQVSATEMFATDAGQDVVIVKYNSSGALLWATHLDSTGDVDIAGLSIDGSNGAVIAAGTFAGMGTFGADAVSAVQKKGTSVGGLDVYVVRLAGGDGGPEWLTTFGSTLDDAAAGMAMDSMANVGVVGHVSGNIATSIPAMVPAPQFGGAKDAFAISVAPGGDFRWVRLLGAPDHQVALGVAAEPQGTLLVAGEFIGSIDLSPQLVNAGTTAKDMFLVKLHPDDGSPTWSTAIADLNLQLRLGVSFASDPAQGFAVAGSFSDTATFDGNPWAAEAVDAFVLRFNGSNQLAWSEIVHGPDAQRIEALTSVPGGSWLVAGSFNGAMKYGAQTVDTPGMAKDLFVMQLAP